MILTDKCKEHFEIWYLKMLRQKPDIQDRFYDENLLSFFWNSDDIMRNARIIEFFDQMRIYIYENIIIELFDCEIKEYWTIEGEMKRHCLNPYNTRQEAQKQAIQIANEIYNKYIP